MGKTIRVILLIVVLAGTIGLAQRQVAWAQPADEEVQSAQSESISPSVLQDNEAKGGTVKPPPGKAKICKKGNYPLGGVAIVRVHRLAHDYCLTASLRKRSNDTGNIPSRRILADITDIQFFYQNHRIGTLPDSKGDVEICYALPPGKQAQIYFRGFGSEEWKPLITAVTKHTACARAQVSGSYALIAQ